MNTQSISSRALTHDEFVSALRTKIAEGSVILGLEDLIAITDAVDRELDSLRNSILRVDRQLFRTMGDLHAHRHMGDGTPAVPVELRHESGGQLRGPHTEAGPTLRTLHAAMLAREFNVK